MPGHAKRQYIKYIINFASDLKTPFKEVADIMKRGFTDEEYVSTFKECYPHLWEDISIKYTTYQKEDERLIKRGKKRRYRFPKPYNFILYNARHVIAATRKQHENGNTTLSDEEIRAIKEKLRNASILYLEEQKKKAALRLNFVQQVRPAYSGFLLGKYLHHRRTHPEDVDTANILLHEASKYKCRETIDLLQKVNAAERNYHLRYFAFLALQQFGVKEIKLRKNPKGKSKPGDREIPKEMKTPEELLFAIYNSQLEQHKSFDLFLSHSYKDVNELLKIKTMLNSQGINVYIDWVNDRSELQRELACQDTAKVITERIKSSKALMFIVTDSSINSKWTPWELGYAYALNKKICILQMEDVNDLPVYLKIYASAIMENGQIKVKQSDSYIGLKEFINK